MGMLLTRVKQEKLAQLWRYRNYSDYLVKELDIIPPAIANIWTGIINKLTNFFGYEITELEEIERKVPQQLMAVSLRYAQTQLELEEIWRRADYKSISWRGLSRQRFTEREARKVSWDSLFFNDQEGLLLESLTDFLRIRYKLPIRGDMRSKVVVVLALVYKAIIEHGREGDRMIPWLRKELEKFNLPIEIADLENAQWLVHRDESSLKSVERLAEDLVSKANAKPNGGKHDQSRNA